jgi:hypothetical protein
LIFIFKTQTYDQNGEIIGSHFSRATISIAVFSKTSEGWSLNSFRKYFTDSGLFGGNGKEGIGKFSILTVGNNIFLTLRRPIEGNNGYNEGLEDIYFIDGDLSCEILQNVFTYKYYVTGNDIDIRKYLDIKKSKRICL